MFSNILERNLFTGGTPVRQILAISNNCVSIGGLFSCLFHYYLQYENECFTYSEYSNITGKKGKSYKASLKGDRIATKWDIFCIFIKTYNFILFLLILFCPIFQFWLSFSKSTEIKSLKSTEAPHGIYDLSYKVNWNKSVMVEHTFNITLERLGQEYCK